MTRRRAVAMVAAIAIAAGCTATTSATAATAPAVQSSVRTVVVNWGTHVAASQSTSAAGLLDALDNSGYLRGLAADYGLSSRAVYLGAGLVPDAALPATTDNASIASAVRARIGAGALPAPAGATDYVVLLPPGVSPAGSGGQPFCSSHSTFTVGTARAYLIVVADYADTAQQCAAGAQDSAAAVGVNVSRQLVNTVTDPNANGTGLKQAGTGAEIGDACAAAGATGNVDGFIVQPWWSNATGACSFGVTGVGIRAEVGRVTNARNATFRLRDTEAAPVGPAFACTVDGAAVACDAGRPLAVLDVAAGSHVLDVDVESVGHATFGWLVDLTAPTVTLHAPAAVTVSRTVTIGYSGSDVGGAGLAAYDVRYRTASWNGGLHRWLQPAAWQATTSTRVSLRALLGHTYCFAARAHDRAGNVSSWSATQCTAVPLDDAALAAVGAWRRTTSTAAFRHTLSVSATAGAELRLANAYVRRLALVVRTCPTCGRVEVYRGGVLWRSVATRSARVHNRVVVMLPAIAVRTATIHVRPAGGRPVYLDGVAVSAT